MILAQRSKARTVLVSVEQWDTMVDQLTERRFTEAEIQSVAKAYQKRAEGMEYATMDELKARMAERDHVAGKA